MSYNGRLLNEVESFKIRKFKKKKNLSFQMSIAKFKNKNEKWILVEKFNLPQAENFPFLYRAPSGVQSRQEKFILIT